MALPASFLDELRARTSLAALVGRTVRLVRSGREQKGCCPFHNEKTPSFYVYDDRFHCFGCGAHGDAISFLTKSSGLSFIEAVEVLAQEAGITVPKASPQAAEEQARRADLSEIMSLAGAVFTRRLFAPEGAEGLAYLRKRGLTDETIIRFGLGWSGEGRGQLAAALAREGITPAQMAEAGLMKQREDGSQAEFFFNRVMFPIRDRRGKIISFGGRVLGDGQPKYLNGPETALFSKRRTLYGLDFARQAGRDGGKLLVVEGYMDVIALAQAGFYALAPLGTALTEEQFAELWKISPNPVICFDGDAAGRRAALRAADLALAQLAPDRSVSFLPLPDGQDPDDYIRRHGHAAFSAALAGARPLVTALYDMLAEGADRTGPEGKASFRKRLEDTARLIPDKSLAAEYRASLIERYYAERRASFGKNGQAPRRVANLPRPVITPTLTAAERGRLLTAILLLHPALLADVEEAFATIDLPEPCARIRTAMESYMPAPHALDSADLLNHLQALGLQAEAERVLAASPLPDCAQKGAQLAEAAGAWWEFFGLMSSPHLREQRDEQERAFRADPYNSEAWQRLVALNTSLRRAEHGETDDEI